MIKNFLKRYWIFLLLVVINVVLGLIFPEIGVKSLDITKRNVIEMMLVIPPIFVYWDFWMYG